MNSSIPLSAAVARIGLLHNPLSGFNYRHPGMLAQLCSGLEHVVVHSVQNPVEVQCALEELADQHLDLLVICGGDGTVQAVLSILFGKQIFAYVPPLAVLAAGTTNMIAADAGLAGNPLGNLRRLLHPDGRGSLHCVTRPLLRLQIPGQEDRYGMFLGLAAITQGICSYRQSLHHRSWHGLPGICRTILSSLVATFLAGSSNRIGTQLTLATNTVTERRVNALLALITTHERLLFGLKPFWGKEKGLLRCTVVETRASGLLWRLPLLAMGKAWAAGADLGYHSCNAGMLRLWLNSPLALDGELYHPKDANEPVLVSYGGSASFVRSC
ncbi:MAG: acylglycerol kinase family protein [Desulfobulbaceae bacterium]|nr:acylglycerol kinase family protein [Desulfobulbaceae bacterium]